MNGANISTQKYARDVLLETTKEVVASTTKFGDWMTIGSAGVFSMLVASVSDVTVYVPWPHLRLALLFAGASVFFGLISKWMSLGIAHGLRLIGASIRLADSAPADFQPSEFTARRLAAAMWPWREKIRRVLENLPQDFSEGAVRSARRAQRLQYVVWLQMLAVAAGVLAILLGAACGRSGNDLVQSACLLSRF